MNGHIAVISDNSIFMLTFDIDCSKTIQLRLTELYDPSQMGKVAACRSNSLVLLDPSSSYIANLFSSGSYKKV